MWSLVRVITGVSFKKNLLILKRFFNLYNSEIISYLHICQEFMRVTESYV